MSRIYKAIWCYSCSGFIVRNVWVSRQFNVAVFSSRWLCYSSLYPRRVCLSVAYPLWLEDMTEFSDSLMEFRFFRGRHRLEWLIRSGHWTLARWRWSYWAVFYNPIWVPCRVEPKKSLVAYFSQFRTRKCRTCRWANLPPSIRICLAHHVVHYRVAIFRRLLIKKWRLNEHFQPSTLFTRTENWLLGNCETQLGNRV